ATERHEERPPDEAHRGRHPAQRRDRAGEEPDRADPSPHESARAALPAEQHPPSPAAAAALIPEGRGVPAAAVVAGSLPEQSPRGKVMRRQRPWMVWLLGLLALPALALAARSPRSHKIGRAHV